MKSVKTKIWVAGFALFAMFFGSGNLVFPILVGEKTVGQFFPAITGFLLTDVVVTFLGLAAVILYDGHRRLFFEPLGRHTSFVLALIMLLLMGPIGIVPRSITVTYGGLKLLMPQLSFPLFNTLACVLTTLLIIYSKQIVDIIGKFMTPWLLFGLFSIVIAGMISGPSIQSSSISSIDAFWAGFEQGYQTMDLLAVFFFPATIFAYLKASMPKDTENKVFIKMALLSSLIGAVLLSIVYAGLTYSGAQFAEILAGAKTEVLLVLIAQSTLGSFTAPIVCLTIALACLSTASVLIILFAEFLSRDIAERRITRNQAVVITMVASYFFAFYGFDTICNWIAIALSIIYPGLIGLVIVNFIRKRYHSFNYGKLAFWSISSISLVYTLVA